MEIVTIVLISLLIICLLLSIKLISVLQKSHKKQPIKIDVNSENYETKLYEWIEEQTKRKPQNITIIKSQ